MKENQKKKLIDIFEEQKKIEEKNVEYIEEKMTKMDNPGQTGPRLVLEIVKRDSEKHAYIVETLIKTLKSDKTIPMGPEGLTKYDEAKRKEFVSNLVSRDSIKKHIEIEESMINKLKEAKKAAKHTDYAEFIQLMLEEEERHHRMLSNLVFSLYDLFPGIK